MHARSTPSRVVLAALASLAACSPDGAAPAENADAVVRPALGPLATLAALPTPDTLPATRSQAVDASRRTAIVQAASRVAPAVVSVSVITQEVARPQSLWESFFMPPGTQRRGAGFGSGVIVRADGIILTNEHVVRQAEQIRVTLPDGRDFEAEVVGTDQVADIAVLRIRGEALPVAPIGSTRGLLIGEWAVAIGNPFANYFSDAEPTVTAGVISAVGRNIVSSSEERGFYLGMIQTDASINPGNSGGPLVNALGQVIGINASIFSRGGGSEGTGFAIPIERALRIADDLVGHGEVRRAWLGFDVEPVEADAWGRTRGVRVARVAPGSPADRGAIEAGDRLLSANGRSMNTPLDFEAVLLDLRAGDALELALEGHRRPVSLRAAPLPSVTAQRVTVLQEMQLVTVTPQIRAERNLVSEEGALITSISERLGANLGLRAGDVLRQVNQSPVRSADDARQIFEGLRGEGRVRIWVERSGGYVARDIFWRR